LFYVLCFFFTLLCIVYLPLENLIVLEFLFKSIFLKEKVGMQGSKPNVAKKAANKRQASSRERKIALQEDV
jgi:hypothetical protein